MTKNIIETDIAEEMRTSYMDYAMSVIIGRALPDVRDGLKPVHRRVLYSMSEQGNEYNKPYRKSARVVGDVIGKYHPHGDSAVYDTIVRLTQDFSMRYPLIDGQGNFGSVDGDPPAAMRYTEVRMERLAHEMLLDIDKETVDFTPNYDESEHEPVVLPTRIPNLLVNGSTGIAVGMANNIPPHNLNEVVNALLYYMDNRDCQFTDLMQFIPGPDFPTGGIIMGRKGIVEAYSSGRGVISVRARAHIEEEKNGREAIIVTELPYMVNKANLLEKIADLVRDKRIEGISDLRDESDRKGMRMYIQVKKGENAEVVLSSLYKHTQLQTSFGIIMLAIVDKQPKILPLKYLLHLFLQHRVEVVTRRTQYLLKQARQKAHILEGLTIALDNLDEVIEKIRLAENGQVANEVLQNDYKLSKIQAQAILDMRLQRLTGLERDKVYNDYQGILKEIENYELILNNEDMVLDIIREETKEVQERYSDERRTEISEDESDISIEELIKREDMVVTISHEGYIKRSPVSDYRIQNRGGKGRLGMSTKNEDFVENMFVASTHDFLLIFTDFGRVFCKKVFELPCASPTSRGKAVVNLLPLKPEEKICTYLNVSAFQENRFIVMATRKGVVKKVDLWAFRKVRSSGIRAITIDEDDFMIAARLVDGDGELFICTAQGMGVRFHHENIRAMGRDARGVRGIKLKEGDRMVSLEALCGLGSIFTVTENGFGKMTSTEEYPTSKNRGNQGVRIIKTSERNGCVVGSIEVGENHQAILITQYGKIIRISMSNMRNIGRNTQGVNLFTLEEGERVIDISRVVVNEEDGEETEKTQEVNSSEETLEQPDQMESQEDDKPADSAQPTQPESGGDQKDED